MTGQPWVLGVDFGSSASVAVARSGDRIEVVDFDGEARLVSAVYLDDGGNLVAGRPAEALLAAHPDRGVRSPKRLLGQPQPAVLGGKAVPVVTVVAALLERVAHEAGRVIGGPPAEVRLTHPADWNDSQIERLVQAARRAGLPEPGLLSEPLAAAVAARRHHEIPPGERLLVFDLGAGTLDTAVLEARSDSFVVLGRPRGDRDLGGDLLDEAIASLVGERHLPLAVWEALLGDEDPAWVRAAGELRNQARRAKELLSAHPETEFVLTTPAGGHTVRLTRDQVDDVLAPYVGDAIDIARRTVEDSGLDIDAIGTVRLIGGGSHMPIVQDAVARAFPDARVDRSGDPKTAVALGAAWAAPGVALGFEAGRNTNRLEPAAVPAPSGPAVGDAPTATLAAANFGTGTPGPGDAAGGAAPTPAADPARVEPAPDVLSGSPSEGSPAVEPGGDGRGRRRRLLAGLAGLVALAVASGAAAMVLLGDDPDPGQGPGTTAGPGITGGPGTAGAGSAATAGGPATEQVIEIPGSDDPASWQVRCRSSDAQRCPAGGDAEVVAVEANPAWVAGPGRWMAVAGQSDDGCPTGDLRLVRYEYSVEIGALARAEPGSEVTVEFDWAADNVLVGVDLRPVTDPERASPATVLFESTQASGDDLIELSFDSFERIHPAERARFEVTEAAAHRLVFLTDGDGCADGLLLTNAEMTARLQ